MVLPVFPVPKTHVRSMVEETSLAIDEMIECLIFNDIFQWYIIHVLPTPVSMARVIPMVTITNAAVITIIPETPVTNIKV